MSPGAEKVWEAANRYVVLGKEHLQPFSYRAEDRTSDTTFDGESELLRLWFLFPRIRDEAREIIWKAASTRWSLQWCKQKGVPNPEMERHYAEACAKIRYFMHGGLSKVQIELLEEYYLKL